MNFIAEAATNKTFATVVYQFIDILNYLVAIILMVCVLTILYGLAEYIRQSGDEDARKKGRELMLYGVIGIFVFVTVWSLAAIFSNYIGNTTSGIPQFGL